MSSVLIVDDRPGMVEIYSAILRTAGFCVTTLQARPAEGTVVVDRHVDVIVVDVHLSNASGADIDLANASATDPRVEAVRQIIEDTLSQSLSIGELAARVEWSESSLSHRFQEQVGLSITKFRKERRLQRAAHLLVTTHTSIRQIAYRVGYQSLSLADFRRAFRNRFGVSPKVYRGTFWLGPEQAMRI